MSISQAIDTLVNKAAENTKVHNNDYEKDGLLYCGNCNTPKQCRVTFLGVEKTPYCLCKCEQQKRDDEENKLKQEMHDAEIRKRRNIAFPDSAEMQTWTFENDDNENPELSNAAKAYVENFEHFKLQGKGLLMYGTVGTGKTYIAGCIANELINQGRSVLMTSFARIENIAFSAHDKQEFYDSLNRYELLILDDFGIERSTEYMQEIVYTVIDNRIKIKLPLIVTSNLTNDQLKNPTTKNEQRVYSRLLKMCHPINVKGEDRRKQAAVSGYAETKAILGI